MLDALSAMQLNVLLTEHFSSKLDAAAIERLPAFEGSHVMTVRPYLLLPKKLEQSANLNNS